MPSSQVDSDCWRQPTRSASSTWVRSASCLRRRSTVVMTGSYSVVKDGNDSVRNCTSYHAVRFGNAEVVSRPQCGRDVDQSLLGHVASAGSSSFRTRGVGSVVRSATGRQDIHDLLRHDGQQRAPELRPLAVPALLVYLGLRHLRELGGQVLEAVELALGG